MNVTVVYNQVEYAVHEKAVASLRRAFRGKQAKMDGLTKHDLRGKASVVLAKAGMLTDPRPSTGDSWLDRRRAGHARMIVGGRLVDRLIKQWQREGYLERCGAGRYKLV